MRKQRPTVGPDDEDKRLLVIDLGDGIVRGVETNIPEFQGVKVLVLGDKKDSERSTNARKSRPEEGLFPQHFCHTCRQ
jgi:hypothetical protein